MLLDYIFRSNLPASSAVALDSSRGLYLSWIIKSGEKKEETEREEKKWMVYLPIFL